MASEELKPLVVHADESNSLTREPKATADYSEQTAVAIDEAKVNVESGRQDKAIEVLLAVEKQARQAFDAVSVSKLCHQILTIIKSSTVSVDVWGDVTEYVVTLIKKRGQSRRVVSDILALCVTWLDEIPQKETKRKLIQTLSDVTEGKIFVEVQRARLIAMLAKMLEDEGELDEAAKLLQDVPVETFGAMDRREKTEYILSQMRIVLLKRDFVRCQIISRKINPKLLNSEDFEDLKIAYNRHMITYFLSLDDFLSVAKCLHAMLLTKHIQATQSEWTKILERYALFLVLTPLSTERTEQLNGVLATEEKKLAAVPLINEFLTSVVQPRLMKWPLSYGEQLHQTEVFRTDELYAGAEERWKLLRTRVLQHNVVTIGTHYDQIQLNRITGLLAIDSDETEKLLSDLVTGGLIKAKIDRPAGIVSFGGTMECLSHLNAWSTDLTRIQSLLESSSDLVENERMLAAAKAKRPISLTATSVAVQKPSLTTSA